MSGNSVVTVIENRNSELLLVKAGRVSVL